MADEEKEQVSQMCLPCFEIGKTEKAKIFCPKCESFFCGDCLKKHNALFIKHVVQEVSNYADLGSIAFTNEMCYMHWKVVDLYCEDHNQLGCPTCIALEHRCCARVHYIPKATGVLHKQGDMKNLYSQITKTIKTLESIKLKQHTTKSDLDKQRHCCLEEIDENHSQLQRLLENIVKSSKDEIEISYSKLSADLHQHCQSVNQCMDDMRQVKDRLDSCYDNKAQQFVEAKKCENSLKRAEVVSNGAMQNVHLNGLCVSIDKRLETILNELTSIATIIERNKVKKKYEIRLSEDSCIINFVCALDDGSVLIADDCTKRLKRLSGKHYSVIDQLPMKEYPQDVCCINENEVVVAQHKSLVFVSLNPRLSSTKILPMTHFCTYVAYSNNELFVSDDENFIYVYGMQGCLKRMLISDSIEQSHFSKSRHIAVSNDGAKVFVANIESGLVNFDRQGRDLGTLTHSEVSGIRGVCVDGSGGMFLCGYWSNNVVFLDRRGVVMSEIVSHIDGLDRPLSVNYDYRHRRLLVSHSRNNSLLVFDLI